MTVCQVLNWVALPINVGIMSRTVADFSIYEIEGYKQNLATRK